MFSYQFKTLLGSALLILPLVVSFTLPVEAVASKKSLSRGTLTSKSVSQGGISDGGGNAYGLELFDFHEIKNSESVSFGDLLKMVPQVDQILAGLDREVPYNEIDMEGLGTMLKQSLEPKTIYFENAPIDEDACKNLGYATRFESIDIVACQSDNDLRIYKPWFLESPRAAALVIHEMVLAWLRGEKFETGWSKEQLEHKVRIITVEIFNAKRNLPSKLRATLEGAGGIGGIEFKAYGEAEYKTLLGLQKSYGEKIYEFCKNPKVDIERPFANVPEALQELIFERDYHRLVDLQQRFKSEGNSKDWQEEYKEQCEYPLLAYAPVRAPKLKGPCVATMKEIKQELVASLKDYKVKSEFRKKAFENTAVGSAYMAADNCAESASEKNEAINYFKNLLAK